MQLFIPFLHTVWKCYYFQAFLYPKLQSTLFYRKRDRQQREAWTPFLFQRGANQTFPSSSSSVKGTLLSLPASLPPSAPLSVCLSPSLCLSLPHTQTYRAPYTDLAAELGGPILNICSLPHVFGRDFCAPFCTSLSDLSSFSYLGSKALLDWYFGFFSSFFFFFFQTPCAVQHCSKRTTTSSSQELTIQL